jgi:hypothetical protein
MRRPPTQHTSDPTASQEGILPIQKRQILCSDLKRNEGSIQQ